MRDGWDGVRMRGVDEANGKRTVSPTVVVDAAPLGFDRAQLLRTLLKAAGFVGCRVLFTYHLFPANAIRGFVCVF